MHLLTCVLLFLVAGDVSPLKAGGTKKIVEKSVSEVSDKVTEPVVRQNNVVSKVPIQDQPDTNFTYEKYAAFLSKIADTGKYIVLPINEFRKRLDNNKIVIGLRHDVDVDLKKAYDFSKTESDLGFRSTYYILHTADYYLANPNIKSLHTDSILPVLKEMQDRHGFEIGWHNDLVTLQVVYNIDPVTFLHHELKWLRDNGIRIYGTASHGSNYCGIFHYVNFYFFYECSDPPWGKGTYINNTTIPVGSGAITINKGHLSDFGLKYEAYFLNNNKYFSDASFINGKRWNLSMLNLDSLKQGDRVIILLHPVHWHQASTLAEIEAFTIPDQKSSIINPQNSTINIVMPYGYDKSNLHPSFVLSPGAYARSSGSLQNSGVSGNNFNKPVTYTVYAENRVIKKNWTVAIEYAR